MKLTLKCFVHMQTGPYAPEQPYGITNLDMSKSVGYTAVKTMDVEIEIPDDFNPTAAQIDALEKQETELRRQFTQHLNDIHEQISKLQALEYTVAA
jgi:hypothetical protein